VFQKFKVALNPLHRIFLNFAKSYILSSLLQSDDKKWESACLELKQLKDKIKGTLPGHIVAMVTYCATKWTATCSPIIGQFLDTTSLVSTDIECL